MYTVTYTQFSAPTQVHAPTLRQPHTGPSINCLNIMMLVLIFTVYIHNLPLQNYPTHAQIKCKIRARNKV